MNSIEPAMEELAHATPGRATGEEISLYERWKKIYPAWVKGGFQTWRRIVLLVLVGVFYVTPWITWNGRPAVLLDIPARKFWFFSVTFWPQEFVLLSWLLIIAAFSLFFVTVIAGRIWCGWACPQTIWTLCYVWIEKWVEGDRNQRMRLDRGPWNAPRVGKKLVKWSLWAALALSISITFVGFFQPIRGLIPKILAWDLVGWEIFWLGLPAGASFLFSGVLREQVCFHMCPYARFQSVMLDRDSLIISYDESRAEPRGHRPRKADPAELGLGHCIDCDRCVRVCPTGIDIRDGLQYQCIGCAACIDACNHVMDRLGYAPNLIQYSSENADEGQPRSWLRPRLAGYGAIATAMIAAFAWTLGHRVPLALDVIRDRSPLYRENWDGSLENVYTLKIMNREQRDRTYRVDVAAAMPVTITTRNGSNEIDVAAGELASLPVRLRTEAGALSEPNVGIDFTVETLEEPHFQVRETSRFLGPRHEASE